MGAEWRALERRGAWEREETRFLVMGLVLPLQLLLPPVRRFFFMAAVWCGVVRE